MSKIVKVQAPDGTIIKVEGPDSATDEQFIAQGQALYAKQKAPAAPPPAGISAAQLRQQLPQVDKPLGGILDNGGTPAEASILGVDPLTFSNRVAGAGASIINTMFPGGDTPRPNATLPPMTPDQEIGAKTAALMPVAGAAEALGGAIRPAMARALTNRANRLYESALKPGPRSNTLPEVQRMVATGLREAIPITERGTVKLDNLVDTLNTDIKNTIDAGAKQGATVNKFAVASRLSDLAKRLATQVNPETDLATLSESGNEFLRNQPSDIQASMAQALKQGTYQQLKGRAYGELKGAAVESQKTLARGLKEELATQFPEIRDMNLRESDLLQLKDELESAVNRQRNKEMFGIGTPILGAGVKAVTGSTPLGLMSGIARSIIDRPGFKSKLAIALARAGRP